MNGRYWLYMFDIVLEGMSCISNMDVFDNIRRSHLASNFYITSRSDLHSRPILSPVLLDSWGSI